MRTDTYINECHHWVYHVSRFIALLNLTVSFQHHYTKINKVKFHYLLKRIVNIELISDNYLECFAVHQSVKIILKKMLKNQFLVL